MELEKKEKKVVIISDPWGLGVCVGGGVFT